MCVDTSGMAWSWGWNLDGALGRTIQIQSEPWRVASLRAVRVRAASLGLLHSLLLTETAEVYVAGDNSYGQLGTGEKGDATSLYLPRRIEVGAARVLQVAAGCDFSLARTADGRIFSWGSNEHGQTGLGRHAADAGGRHVPSEIEVPFRRAEADSDSEE